MLEIKASYNDFPGAGNWLQFSVNVLDDPCPSVSLQVDVPTAVFVDPIMTYYASDPQ